MMHEILVKYEGGGVQCVFIGQLIISLDFNFGDVTKFGVGLRGENFSGKLQIHIQRPQKCKVSLP